MGRCLVAERGSGHDVTRRWLTTCFLRAAKWKCCAARVVRYPITRAAANLTGRAAAAIRENRTSFPSGQERRTLREASGTRGVIRDNNIHPEK